MNTTTQAIVDKALIDTAVQDVIDALESKCDAIDSSLSDDLAIAVYKKLGTKVRELFEECIAEMEGLKEMEAEFEAEDAAERVKEEAARS